MKQVRASSGIEEGPSVHFDVADLTLFVSISELGNLTRGAERAALSPAAASARLKSLETQLRSRLFYRESRGVTLTPAGEALLRHARVILRQLEHVKSEFSLHSRDSVGHVRIFANTTAITEVLPHVLANFMSKRPQVTVDLQERNTREVVRGILDSAADIGIVAGPAPTAGLQARCFSTDRLVLVTPAAHPLSRRGVVEFEESMIFPHIGLKGSTLQDFLSDTVSRFDGKLRMRVLMGSFEGMCRMIEAGVGIGVLPESAAARLAGVMRLSIVQLADRWSIRERRVLYRELEALPSCAHAFLDELMELGARSPPTAIDTAGHLAEHG